MWMKHAVHNTKCTMQICRIGVVQQCYKMDIFLLKYVKFVHTVCIILLCAESVARAYWRASRGWAGLTGQSWRQIIFNPTLRLSRPAQPISPQSLTWYCRDCSFSSAPRWSISMIIDHRHDDQRKDAEKTDVVEDRDDNDADEGEWVKGFSSRSVTMPPNPLSTTRLQCNTLHKSAWHSALKDKTWKEFAVQWFRVR